MGEAFITRRGGSGGSGGGSELVIVGGTTSPAKADHNTIWLNTPNTITSYVLSATEPTKPVEGMAWVTIGDSGNMKVVSPVGGDWITVYPLSAKQYIGGAWVDRTAMSYQGGEWVDWWDRSTIYKDGNQYEFITGGWKSLGFKWGSQTVSGSIEYGEYLTVKTPSGGVYDATTAKKIDLTAYSQILYDIASDSSTDNEIVIIHNIAPGGNLVSGGTTYWAAASNNGVINLTGLNGEYYISVVPTNGRTFKIGNIRLVK